MRLRNDAAVVFRLGNIAFWEEFLVCFAESLDKRLLRLLRDEHVIRSHTYLTAICYFAPKDTAGGKHHITFGVNHNRGLAYEG